MLKWLHPMRAGKIVFSENLNPWMAPIALWSAAIRVARMEVDDSNPLVRTEQAAGNGISHILDGFREWRDAASEATFKALYGNVNK